MTDLMAASRAEVVAGGGEAYDRTEHPESTSGEAGRIALNSVAPKKGNAAGVWKRLPVTGG